MADPNPASGSGGHLWLLGLVLGIFAGWVDVKVADLLLTALLVLAFTMALGFARPRQPWRWSLLVALFVPLAQLVAVLVDGARPYRAQIFEAFLVLLPAVVGAYGGFFLRRMAGNIVGHN